MVEAVGRRFAAGSDTRQIGGSILGALTGMITGAPSNLRASAAKVMSWALDKENVTLVAVEELNALRNLAADAAAGRDLGPTLDQLKAFYRKQTDNTRV